MANEHTEFWLALLNQSQDVDQRTRLWNGYLGWKLPPRIKGEGEPQQGWPKLIVAPPDGGWPELTEEEQEIIQTLAKEHGGRPEFKHHRYMDFSGHTFSDMADFSGLILVRSNFDKARFKGYVKFSDKTRFYGQSWFQKAIFEEILDCENARFDGPASFRGSCFKGMTTFLGTEFRGGASFTNVVFEMDVMFDDSKFEERYFSGSITVPHLVDFNKAKFMDRVSFRKVLFGNDASAYSRKLWPERRVDFTDAEFRASTSFHGAMFGGVPAFFNTTLHEDTDFSSVDWKKAETDNIPVDYAIRAWERLELIMSKLEKPLDRHLFFRFKMRARRRTDGHLLRILNWLFDKIADYGWGVGRTFAWWFGHWAASGLMLFANTGSATTTVEWWRLLLAALGTGFANAHAFLRFTAEGGYLEPSQKLLEENDKWELLTAAIGTAEAVLGPIFLFLILLTLRNRFRLA